MTDLLNKKSVLRVKEFLDKNNLNIKLIVLKETAKTAIDAANSLGTEVGAIVKSLIFKNYEDSKYYLCLVSGDQYVSFNKLYKIIGHKIIKGTAKECKKLTGFSIGGVSPFAHTNSPNKIFIDNNLKKYDLIFAAGGHPHVVFSITYKNLIKYSNAIEQSIVD